MAKLVRMAMKLQRVASFGRKETDSSDECSTSSVADRGNFVIYTLDGNRFMIPLAYLASTVFIQLLKMSEDEFGITSDGPITLPCDSVFMGYIISLFRKKGSKATEKMLLETVFQHQRVLSSSNLDGSGQQQAVCSF